MKEIRVSQRKMKRSAWDQTVLPLAFTVSFLRSCHQSSPVLSQLPPLLLMQDPVFAKSPSRVPGHPQGVSCESSQQPGQWYRCLRPTGLSLCWPRPCPQGTAPSPCPPPSLQRTTLSISEHPPSSSGAKAWPSVVRLEGRAPPCAPQCNPARSCCLKEASGREWLNESNPRGQIPP